MQNCMTLDAFKAVHTHSNTLVITERQTDETCMHTFTQELAAALFKTDHEEFSVSLFRKAARYSKMLFLFIPI
jgi:hypothetical protein